MIAIKSAEDAIEKRAVIGPGLDVYNCDVFVTSDNIIGRMSYQSDGTHRFFDFSLNCHEDENGKHLFEWTCTST